MGQKLTIQYIPNRPEPDNKFSAYDVEYAVYQTLHFWI